MNNEYEYRVCVQCTTYNHGRYIRKCLDGFVMQQTDFIFIVVVVDDASTDDTQLIISEYATRYPSIIRPILLKENHYSMKKNKNPYFEPYVKQSKYVAFCEGDDYWSDPYKLQKQVDALEKHDDCLMCVHKTDRIDENGNNLNRPYPSFFVKNGRIESKRFIGLLCDDFTFHLSSYLIKSTDYINYRTSGVVFRQVARCGDIPLMLYFGQLGNVYYIDDTMSCYRLNSVGSHTEKMLNKDVYRYTFYDSIDNMMFEFDKYTNYKYHRYCQLIAQRYRGIKLQLTHYLGDITTDQYEKEIIKKKYRYFFRRNTPFKVRMLTYLDVYTPSLGRFVKKHFTHQQ